MASLNKFLWIISNIKTTVTFATFVGGVREDAVVYGETSDIDIDSKVATRVVGPRHMQSARSVHFGEVHLRTGGY